MLSMGELEYFDETKGKYKNTEVRTEPRRKHSSENNDEEKTKLIHLFTSDPEDISSYYFCAITLRLDLPGTGV
jgi:hypothetical protein